MRVFKSLVQEGIVIIDGGVYLIMRVDMNEAALIGEGFAVPARAWCKW